MAFQEVGKAMKILGDEDSGVLRWDGEGEAPVHLGLLG